MDTSIVLGANKMDKIAVIQLKGALKGSENRPFVGKRCDAYGFGDGVG